MQFHLHDSSISCLSDSIRKGQSSYLSALCIGFDGLSWEWCIGITQNGGASFICARVYYDNMGCSSDGRSRSLGYPGKLGCLHNVGTCRNVGRRRNRSGTTCQRGSRVNDGFSMSVTWLGLMPKKDTSLRYLGTTIPSVKSIRNIRTEIWRNEKANITIDVVGKKRRKKESGRRMQAEYKQSAGRRQRKHELGVHYISTPNYSWNPTRCLP